MYQGRVYSISGNDSRYPALYKTAFKSGYSIIRPNCRHSWSPYHVELYSEEERRQALERSNRTWKPDGDGRVFQQTERARAEYSKGQQLMRQWNAEIVEYERMKAYYAEQGQEPPYKSLGAFMREVRKPHEKQSPAMRAWKRHVPDKQQYERWKGIVGERYMPKTVDEFQQIKYNRDRQQEFEKLRQIRAQEIDYKVAETGGAHSGKLADYQKNFSIAALEKTVKNLDEKIALHISKINIPEQHYPDWEKRDPREREGLIKHWRKEVANFQRQRNIALAELRRRRNE